MWQPEKSIGDLKREIIVSRGVYQKLTGKLENESIKDYMLELIITWHKNLRGDSVGKGLFPKKLLEIVINVTIKYLAGELEEDFVRSDSDSFFAWGFVKQPVISVILTCQGFIYC